MIGIVVVSHSYKLAQAAIELASEMVEEDKRPTLLNAAGLDEETIGTDAMRVSEAIEQLATADGVLVFMDLGSAVLSTEMAVEFVDPELAKRVELTSAPFVEGLISAIVTASTGASLTEVAEEARAGLRGKQDSIGDSEDKPVVVAEPDSGQSPVGGETRTFTITNAHGLHARPAATLVAGLRDFDATVTLTNARGKVSKASSVTGLATLGILSGDDVTVTAYGPDAASALEAFAAMVDDEFGEKVDQTRLPADPTTFHDDVAPKESTTQSADSESSDARPVVTGSEIVIAPAYVLSHEVDLSDYVSGDETERLANAHVAVAEYLRSITGGQAGDIARAQLAMLDDPDVVDQERQLVANGHNAPEAVAGAWGPYADEFAALDDPYMAARAEDIRSLERMLLRALVGQDIVPAIPDGSVLVVRELDASTAATLDPSRTPGVVTTRGGASGHGVIVAKSIGLAILTGRADAEQVVSGDLVVLDPLDGELVLRPDEQVVADFEQRKAQRAATIAEATKNAHEPALTQSGMRVLVEANVGSMKDARTGADRGAEGSGLVRTELLWGDETQAPSVETQADSFEQIARLMGHTVTVRTWDVGADKPLAFMPLAKEDNPFLGVRGVRAMQLYPDLFTTQLRAVCRAAAAVEKDGSATIRVMLPMVSTPEEVRWGRDMLEAAATEEGVEVPSLGMMLEIPAAALRANEFSGLVDFISVGTNDLTQYTTAVDRGNGAVSALGAEGRDAVLELIAIAHERLPEVPIAVCGDWASDTTLTSELIERGVTELSARASSIALVKQAVRDTQ